MGDLSCHQSVNQESYLTVQQLRIWLWQTENPPRWGAIIVAIAKSEPQTWGGVFNHSSLPLEPERWHSSLNTLHISRSATCPEQIGSGLGIGLQFKTNGFGFPGFLWGLTKVSLFFSKSFVTNISNLCRSYRKMQKELTPPGSVKPFQNFFPQGCHWEMGMYEAALESNSRPLVYHWFLSFTVLYGNTGLTQNFVLYPSH